jgi:hypothetical protein
MDDGFDTQDGRGRGEVDLKRSKFDWVEKRTLAIVAAGLKAQDVGDFRERI